MGVVPELGERTDGTADPAAPPRAGYVVVPSRESREDVNTGPGGVWRMAVSTGVLFGVYENESV